MSGETEFLWALYYGVSTVGMGVRCIFYIVDRLLKEDECL